MSLRHELDRYAVRVATLLFVLLALPVGAGDAEIPGGLATLLIYPLGLLALERLRPESVLAPDLRGAAGLSVLVLAALWLVPYLLTLGPVIAGLPVVAGAALLLARFPATGIVVTLLLTALVGTFQAFLGFSPSLLVDLMLAALWVVVLARIAIGRPYRFVVWPAILGAAFYFLLTAIDLFASDDFGVAWLGFHTTVWYMLALLAIAYAGWSRETYRRIAIGFVVTTGVLAAYAIFRWIVGPATEEAIVATYAGNGINVDPVDKHLKAVGTFTTGHELALWMAFMAPFCAAMILVLRGRGRLLPLAAFALAIPAIIVSEARGPLVGMIVGVAVVLAIYQFSRAYPGLKAGVIAGAIGVFLLCGAGAIAVVTSNPDDVERYTGILNPGDDPTFIQRELKWAQLLPEIESEPFGHGLGTGGAGATSGRYVEPSRINIDNSYLKIGYEQGLIVMAAFVAIMLGLLAHMAIAAARTASRDGAAIAAGACGTLASMLVSFYTGLYIEALPILAGWIVVGVGLSYLVARDIPETEAAPERVPPADRAPAPTDPC